MLIFVEITYYSSNHIVTLRIVEKEKSFSFEVIKKLNVNWHEKKMKKLF